MNQLGLSSLGFESHVSFTIRHYFRWPRNDRIQNFHRAPRLLPNTPAGGSSFFLLCLAAVWVVGFAREILAFWREVAYFEELGRLENLDSTYQSGPQMGHS